MSVWLVRSVLACLALLLGALPAVALDIDTKGEIENLRNRIEKLEGRKAEPGEAFVIEALGKKLTFWGSIELEAYFREGGRGDSTSNITLATAQLGVELEITDNIGGHIVFLHEEEDEAEPIEIDEANITLFHPGKVMGGRVGFFGGRLYVPFGNFTSGFISDPLTLEMGETNNTAVVFQWANELAAIKIGFFNGGVDKAGKDDMVDTLVASLSLAPAKGVNLGTSFISDLAESDTVLVKEESLYESGVGAVSVFATLEYAAFTLDAEYLFATANFDQALVGAGTDLTGRRPSALNIELGFVPAERWYLGARYEKAEDFKNDPSRYGAVASFGIFKNTVIALEYLLEDAGDTSHTVTAQLAFKF